jgi:DNA (cytosine-5)-methyltransferase 1
MKALDLFCGGGGASRGLADAGYEVTGVDLHDQRRDVGGYPFAFIKADALTVDPEWVATFDLVWASPPCQRFSAATRQTGNPEDHPDLVEPIREMLEQYARCWIIENVLGAPLIEPIMLCGTMFGLGVVRHRLFECSFDVTPPPHPKHAGSLVTGEYVTVAGNGGVPAWTLRERERRGLPRHRPGEMELGTWQRAMAIDWLDRKQLVQAIPPAYSRFLAEQAIASRRAS